MKPTEDTEDKELRKEVKKVVDDIHALNFADFMSLFVSARQDVDLIIKVVEKLGYDRRNAK